MSDINANHVTYDEIVSSLSPHIAEDDSAPVLPEIARSGGDYAKVTKSRILIQDSRNRMSVISSPGGSPGDPHLHDDFNEWWIVFGGEMRYRVGEYEPFLAHFGDIVVAPCGYRHDPRAWKGDMCMRMVIGKPGSNHDLKGLEPARTIPLDDRWEPPNRILTPLQYMIDRHGINEPWSETVILDQRNRVEMVHELPGNDIASVAGVGESWWVVLHGSVQYQIGDEAPFVAGKGSVVYAEQGIERNISVTGDESAILVEILEPSR